MGTQTLQQTNINQANITSISCNARVDYILRFSKQAVLVVDEHESAYSPIAMAYLANLDGKRNCAFVSSSERFNDIQIRCRIIEQLFGNTLFDPEQSLAISVINYTKPTAQAISIVIEHAQTLSLQLLHELSQLAELAKKTQLDIDIVMVGSLASSQLVAKNKAVFRDKLAIVNAKDGQLISLNSRLLKDNGGRRLSTTAIVLMAVIALLTIFSSATLYSLYQRDSLSYSSILEKQQTTPSPMSDSEKAIISQQAAKESPSNSLQVATIAQEAELDSTLELANVNEIAQAIMATQQPAVVNPQLKESLPAVSSDQSKVEESSQQTSTQQSDVIDDKAVPVAAAQAPDNTKAKITTADYYQTLSDGYIVQLGLYANQATLAAEQEKLANIATHYYSKRVNGKIFFVLTSQAFTEKEQAKQFVTSLPAEIQKANPWIKSVSSVKQDFNK